MLPILFPLPSTNSMEQPSYTSYQHRVEVVVDHNLISPPSYTADDAEWEPTSAAHLSNCTPREISRTIASDYELDSDPMEKTRG